MVDFIRNGVHVLLIDLFPPTPHAPLPLHKLIWDKIEGEHTFVLSEGKDRLIASYEAKEECSAYLEPFGLKDALQNMPLFIKHDHYVDVPLGKAYDMAWERCPEPIKQVVITGKLPKIDLDDEA